jgi:hypothetical protein
MSSLLQQLENNEAVLLMYLAEELPAEDRAEVGQMLATDANLRAELERLRASQDGVTALVAAADAARRPRPAAPAVRRVGREIHQWQVRRFAPPPPPEPSDELRFAWWSYPLATAAAVLIAFLVWWGNQDTTVNTDPRRDEFVREQQEWDERMRRRERWWAVGREFREAPVEGLDRLVEIEGQLALFAQSAEHLSDPDLIFLEASGEMQ